MLRRRLDDEQQAVFGMLLAGIPSAEIAPLLGLSRAGLDSRQGAMLRRLEALPSEVVDLGRGWNRIDFERRIPFRHAA
jgi:hypothetical protein